MLSGLSAFTLTPMDDDGVVDTDHLGRLVARLAATDVDSIGVLGSTGSYMYLTARERARALAASVEAAGSTPVLAGIGALRTSDVLAHARAAEEAGAAAALLAPVSYLPLTEADFAALVADVTAASGLPLCLYNNPTTTHFSMSEDLVVRLARNKRVRAVKNPAQATGMDEQITRLRGATHDDFVLGYSGDALIDAPLGARADAWYSVIAGALPELCLGIWSPRGTAELAARHGALEPLWALFRAHGGIRVLPHMLELMGHGRAPLPRPLQPLAPAIVAEIDAALDAVRAPA